jgi:adenylate kinase family enzyme
MVLQRIMIFGLPGSGKSTFSIALAKSLNLPLYHLDKHFFVDGWVERNKDEFLQIQKEIVNQEQWIIDGNALSSLELRYARASLVLYFCSSRPLCLSRLIKRRFIKDISVDDRAAGCRERLPLHLIRYMWTFDRRVSPLLKRLRASYPKTAFYKIENSFDLNNVYKFIKSIK